MPGADPQHTLAPGPVALKTLIGATLEKILASSVFKTADSLRELLRFTVQETLAGRGRDLKEYVLATAVLGKGESFDPKADPVVRVQMRRLREHLHQYYATEGQNDPVFIDIPKGTYAPLFRSTSPENAAGVSAGLEQTRIVGRQKELAELQAAFESAAAGHGIVFCLCGEPGIGKTTIVEVFLRNLSASGVGCYIARGRCSERLAGSEAYLPVLEALESLLRRGGEPLSDVMSAVAPTWYVQIAPPGDDSSADRILGESRVASQERLKRELVAFLEELARRQPLVFFVDDLHWADASTVDVLSYAAARCGSRRILIVGIYRQSDLLAASHPFLRVKLELQGHGLCREVAMQFLTRADVDNYLALQFPEHLFPPELATRIHQRTEGNPLFMADLVRLLRDQDVLTQHEGRWVVSGQLGQIEHELPESVRSMIRKKIGELSEADRRLLSAAAVQGQEFDSAVVARALEMDPADAEERLETLDRVHGFVRFLEDHEFPDSTLTLRYGFVHILYQNALYGAVTATRKAALSMAVAQALEHFYRDKATEVASRLALLLEAGRDFGRASDFFLSAARNAAKVYAAQEAIALAHRAIANAEKLNGRERNSRVMAAALVSAAQHSSLTRFDEAVADFETAESAAELLGDREAQVNAIYGKAMVLLVTKRLPEVREQGSRALQLAEEAGSAVAVASSNLILGLERGCVGDYAAGKEQFERAVPVLRQSGPLNLAVTAVAMRGGFHTHRLEHDQADLDLEWASEQAAKLGLSFDLLIARFHQARTRGNRGLLSDALQMLEETLRLADLLGDRFWRHRLLNTRGWVLSELLDNEAALPLNIEAVQSAQELGDVEAECVSRINAARDYLALGEPERAWEHLQQAAARYEQDVWFRWIYYPRLQAEMASYWIIRGDLVQALSHARCSLEQAERTMSRKRMAWAHKLLGEIAALNARPEVSRREFDAALQLLKHHPCPTIEWQILQAAAGMAHMLHDNAAHSDFLGRARTVVQILADSVRDDAVRRKFLCSKPIRDLLR